MPQSLDSLSFIHTFRQHGVFLEKTPISGALEINGQEPNELCAELDELAGWWLGKRKGPGLIYNPVEEAAPQLSLSALCPQELRRSHLLLCQCAHRHSHLQQGPNFFVL